MVSLLDSVIASIEDQDPELSHFAHYIKKELGENMGVEGRFSTGFFLDCLFGLQAGKQNVQAVFSELLYLEGKGASQTKTESMFTREPLKGFWHKHFMPGDMRNIGVNTQNALTNYGIPIFDNFIEDAKETGQEFFSEEQVLLAIDDAVSGNLARRRCDQKMTGEWIIYTTHQGEKYYLCLASHDDGDEAIYAQIKKAVADFSWLKEILGKE